MAFGVLDAAGVWNARQQGQHSHRPRQPEDEVGYGAAPAEMAAFEITAMGGREAVKVDVVVELQVKTSRLRNAHQCRQSVQPGRR